MKGQKACYGNRMAQREVEYGWFYLIVIILFVAATLLFAVQNLQVVTLSFLGFGASVPLALLVALVYLLAWQRARNLFALLRQSMDKSGLRDRPQMMATTNHAGQDVSVSFQIRQ